MVKAEAKLRNGTNVGEKRKRTRFEERGWRARGWGWGCVTEGASSSLEKALRQRRQERKK